MILHFHLQFLEKIQGFFIINLLKLDRNCDSPKSLKETLGETIIPVILYAENEDEKFDQNINYPSKEFKLVMQMTNDALYFYHESSSNYHNCVFKNKHYDSDSGLCFYLSYEHILEMSFFNTSLGMFNNNPNDHQ